MMMEDDMIIYKDKNVQLREMMRSEEIYSACKSQPTIKDIVARNVAAIHSIG